MSIKLLEFDVMSESEMYRMVREIYAEASLENAQWRHPELVDYEEAVKEEEMLAMDFIRTFMQKEENKYYVLESDGQWVSALRLTKINDFYYLEALETSAEHRKKGFATKIINEVILRLKERGRVIIRSNVDKENLASLATHRKCGFEIEEENGINYLTGEQSEYVYGMLYPDKNSI